MAKKIAALVGGVGGAKLALGLSLVLSSDEVTFIVNTGDDFEYCGLKICPDIDTVCYTLAGINNKELGWGVENESWNCFNKLKEFDDAHWFHLGDKDIATHLTRLRMLGSGKRLSQVTNVIANKLGAKHTIIPMSDEAAPTVIESTKGPLDFQEYFVKKRCLPIVKKIKYGSSGVLPSESCLAVLQDPLLDAVVICPSNPFLSIAPILHLKGMRECLASINAPKVAVSPLVGSTAVKGPTAKIMNELKIDCSAKGIAAFYKDIINALIIDESDAAQKSEVEAFGLKCFVTPTLMKSNEDKKRLALAVLEYAELMHG